MGSGKLAGSAGLVLVEGVVHLDEEQAVFEAMLEGWARQQKSRLLGDSTIDSRVALLRRFLEFADSYPWAWAAGDVEDFTVSLMSGASRLAPSTIRGYHLTLRMFCDYLVRRSLRVAEGVPGPFRPGSRPRSATSGTPSLI